MSHLIIPSLTLDSSSNLSNDKGRVRNLKFATYLKFATCENTNKINELRRDLLTI